MARGFSGDGGPDYSNDRYDDTPCEIVSDRHGGYDEVIDLRAKLAAAYT